MRIGFALIPQESGYRILPAGSHHAVKKPGRLPVDEIGRQDLLTGSADLIIPLSLQFNSVRFIPECICLIRGKPSAPVFTFHTDGNGILPRPQKPCRNRIFPGRVLIICMSHPDAVNIYRVAVHDRSQPNFRLPAGHFRRHLKAPPKPYASYKIL